jgi:hypothetical protein
MYPDPFLPYDQTAVDKDKQFRHAFLNCGTATRTRRSTIVRQFPAWGKLTQHFPSTRQTSKSRDFILAIMPQYTFYTVPHNAKHMTFGELFNDCMRQLQLGVNNQDKVFPNVLCRVANGMVQRNDDIPEPRFLGDLTKLFCGPIMSLKGSKVSQIEQHSHRVHVRPIPSDGHDVMRLIWSSYNLPQQSVWYEAKFGEIGILSKEGQELGRAVRRIRQEDCTFTDDDYYLALFSLNHTVTLNETRDFIEGEAQNFTEDDTVPPSAEAVAEAHRLRTTKANEIANALTETPDILSVVARMAAMISCRLGLSALQWSERILTPVLVEFREEVFMALVPSETLQGHRFYLIPSKPTEVPRLNRLMLVGCSNLEPGPYVTC